MCPVEVYSQEYIDGCRFKIKEAITAYDLLVDTATAQAGPDNYGLIELGEGFETHFFNTMVLILDGYFGNRLGAKEGRDSNPLIEVRTLCYSIKEKGEIFTADKSVKIRSELSVLKYQFGDRIAISKANFINLSDAFFDEIERRYVLARIQGT